MELLHGLVLREPFSAPLRKSLNYMITPVKLTALHSELILQPWPASLSPSAADDRSAKGGIDAAAVTSAAGSEATTAAPAPAAAAAYATAASVLSAAAAAALPP
eukprot:362289-Chlamydomonas_euryale.AAC.8